MKLLLLASNPDTSSSLSLDREITALQRRFIDVSPEPFEFIPIPDVRVEDLPSVLGKVEPDILHVTAHGETSHLVVSDARGERAVITSDQLVSFLSPRKPPRLVYFNGCRSADISAKVLGRVAIAIGTEATIENGSARAAAVAFYERLLEGESVGVAFDAAAAMAAVKQGITLELRSAPAIDPTTLVLMPRPRLVARFVKIQRGTQDNAFPVRLGITQCPGTTTRLAAFAEDDDLLCLSTRPEWNAGVAWLAKDVRVGADRRVFMVGVVAETGRFIAKGRLSQSFVDTERAEVRWAIDNLIGASADTRVRQ